MNFKRENKILYIDPLSPNGHINFNNIQIKSLYKIFDSIDFSFKKGYEKKICIKNTETIFLIPEKFYKSTNNKIITRINLLKILRYIKKNIDLSIYDFIIFSSYEEISLYFSFIKYPLILVNHNNIVNLNNPIKRFFFKKVAKNNINLVLNDYIKDYLIKMGIQNIEVINHGLPLPMDNKILKQNFSGKFSFIDNFEWVIFSASSSSSDKIFIDSLLPNKAFQSFLNKNNILFILKGDYTNHSHSNNIYIINNYLTDKEYQYLFLKCSIILICYPPSFKYRVSATLLECMTNNKLCLLSDIEALGVYKHFFKYNPYYKTVDDLINKIDLLINNYQELKENPYLNLSELNSSIENIFKNLDS